MPIVAVSCGVVGSVGAGLVEGSLQAARDTRRDLVLARHGEIVKVYALFVAHTVNAHTLHINACSACTSMVAQPAHQCSLTL